MEFQVDGENKGTIRPPGGAFSSIQTINGYSYASAWNTKMAPFDQEVIIKSNQINIVYSVCNVTVNINIIIFFYNYSFQ